MFSKVSAVQLGVAAVKGVLAQSGVKPEHVEDVYFGNVLQGGVGQSPARQVALGAGCPDTTEATTVNKVRADPRPERGRSELTSELWCAGLRVGHEGRHARQSEHPDWAEGRHDRWRHGEHVERAVSRPRLRSYDGRARRS